MKFRFDTNLLILGNGDVIKDASLVVEDEKITYAGEQEHAPGIETADAVPVIMPGLWDTHAHFTGIRKADITEVLNVPPHLAALRTVWDAEQAIAAGITSVREVGGHGIFLGRAIREGFVKGPRIYAAGDVISATAGHGDLHGLPIDVVTQFNQHGGGLGVLADGVPECLRAVRLQMRKGAEVIKYCASGGVMSEIDHPIHQQFSLEEQKAIVEEAKRAELAVASHCHGAPGIRAALEAGVTTIDHGTYLDEDLADLMIEKGAILVPTLFVVRRLLDFSKELGIPDYALAKAKEIGDIHRRAIEMAIRKGVPIAMGTDIFTSGSNPASQWGQNAFELVYLVEAGMSPSEAIIAGTSMGPKTLGLRAPKSGVLQAGYDADFLLLSQNPLDDIKVLTERSNILGVYKHGVQMN